MDLNAIADFGLIAQEGGLGKASRRSGRSKATLSRRVAELEEQLGLRLVERGPRGLVLTEAGELLVALTEGPLQEIAEAVSAVKQKVAHPRGRLRIAAPLLFSQLALGRLCAEFKARFPEVQIEVIAEDRVSDLVGEHFDVAIRPNPDPQSTLVGRCFARDHMLVVASPSIEIPAFSAGSVVMPAVAYGMRATDTFSMSDGAKKIEPSYVLRFSSLLMVRDAVEAGAGVAMLPNALVWRHVNDGRLVTWGAVDGGEVELWVLHAARRLASAKVRVFVDFLCSQYPDGLLYL